MKLLDSFYKLSKPLAECAGFQSKITGEYVELNWMEKAVYSYMLSRIEFFTGKLKSEHFECQVTIGNQLNMDYKMVGKIMRKFMEHSVVNAALVKPKVGQKRYHYYSVEDDLDLWVWDYELTETRHYKKVGKKPLESKDSDGKDVKLEPVIEQPSYDEYMSAHISEDDYDPYDTWQPMQDEHNFKVEDVKL